MSEIITDNAKDKHDIAKISKNNYEEINLEEELIKQEWLSQYQKNLFWKRFQRFSNEQCEIAIETRLI